MLGKVKNRVIRGENLEASVEGSFPTPYRVSLSISEGGNIQSTSCSCPDDYYGDCKHIVAVLLDWIGNKDSFKEVETVDRSIEGRSREELEALIQEMLEREPGLKTLLEEPLPGFSDTKGSIELVDPIPYRQDVRNMIDGFYGRKDGWEVASSPDTLVKRGKKHLENEEIGVAEAIFKAVLIETLDFYGQIYGHEGGEIHRVIEGAIDGMIECLKVSPEQTDFRNDVLDTLYWVIDWDIDYGGINLMYDPRTALTDHTNREDRERLREKVIDDLEGSPGSDWRKRQYGMILLELHQLDGGKEDFLEDVSQFDLPKLKALTLLDLEQKEEAVKAAGEIDREFDILPVANKFIEKGYENTAEKLVSDVFEKNTHDRVKRWLSDFYEGRGDLEKALEVELNRFRSRPSLSRYKRVLELAGQLRADDEYRSKLLTELENEEKFKVIARIYMEEGELDKAWEYAEKKENKSRWGGTASRLKDDIADVGKEERPCRAIEYYKDRVYDLVAMRGRKNYRNAAGYLKKIRDIYKQEGEEKEWEELIYTLREEFDNLPACQDEFDKAGL